MNSILIIFSLMISLNLKAFDSAERIIGTNDLVPVDATASNIPLKFQKIVDAFGLMNMGCTATHIGNGYVMTAGHCFWAPPSLIKNQPCSETTIEWGLRSNLKPYMKSTCLNIIAAQRAEGNDFALIKVSPIPRAFVKIELKRKAVPLDQVTIFSHPDELPLSWSKNCVIEFATDTSFAPDFLQHKCDTNPGSSGATIIDINSMAIVGIHDGGHLTSPEDGMNYGSFLTNPEIVRALKEIGFNK